VLAPFGFPVKAGMAQWSMSSLLSRTCVRGWACRPRCPPNRTRGGLRPPQIVSALADGPPSGNDWRSFAFVLRAGERVLDLREHGFKPSARELAGLVDHTKAWTPAAKSFWPKRTGIDVEVAAMSPELLAEAPRALDLSDWDRDQLAQPNGRAGSLEDLRAAIVASRRKVEQETLQQRLLHLFSARPAQTR